MTMAAATPATTTVKMVYLVKRVACEKRQKGCWKCVWAKIIYAYRTEKKLDAASFNIFYWNNLNTCKKYIEI